jgi:hypothetical protein
MARILPKSSLSTSLRSGGSVPKFPDLSEYLGEIPGIREATSALQKWRIQMERRWDTSDSVEQKRVRDERITRESEDFVLVTRLEQTIADLGGAIASVSELSSALATATGYLEARYTLQVAAGDVVTGMTLFSSTGPDTDVSYVAFQADRFQINTSSGRKEIFSATATEVKLGDVLTVDLDNAKVYIGGGTFSDAGTPFFVDDLGRLSLKDRFVWDGTSLSFNGTGTNGSRVTIDDNGLSVGANTATGMFYINDNGGVPYINFRYNSNVYGTWSVSATKSVMQLSDNASHAVTIDGIGQIVILGAAASFGLTVSNDVLILGDLNSGTHSPIGSETITGFITHKDLAGTVRKLAVVS